MQPPGGGDHGSSFATAIEGHLGAETKEIAQPLSSQGSPALAHSQQWQ